AHAAAAYLISPAGKISRYLYGIEYNNKDLKFSLMDASDGKIGNVVDRLIFYCFQFDPKKNKYTLYAINLMKAGATVAVIVMTLFLVPVWIRSRKEKGALK
ncbi:MAG: SCO family protein, partial [Bdellovibrionales bacterium]|nr:SCO family protein [Bdellovibrionales bacterium]